MPTYNFTARTADGQARNGHLDAPELRQAANQLRERGWLVLSLRASATSDGNTSRAAMGGTTLPRLLALPVRSVHIEIALAQLAVMLRSGVTLLAALSALADQSAHPMLRRIARRVATRIAEGATFSDALAEHRCFPPLVIHFVRLGEASGTLDNALSESAGLMERARLLRSDMLTALLYPVGVLVITIGVTAFLVLVTLPRLQVMLTALGRPLPPLTQWLMDVSFFLQSAMPQLLGGATLVVGSALALWSWPPGQLFLARALLRVPVVGGLLRLGATALLCRTLSTMLDSGLNLVDALSTVQTLIANPYLAAVVHRAREGIFTGHSLAESLDCRRAFLPLLGSMIGVGEASGSLAETLGEVASFSELQLRRQIALLSSLVGPLTIVLVGTVVGVVYIAFFLALFAAAGG